MTQLFRIKEGNLLLPKPKIETSFCFNDEGADYELYKSLRGSEEKLAEYFLSKNKREIQCDIDSIKEEGVYLYEREDGVYTYSWRKPHRSETNRVIKADEETTKLIIEGLEYALAAFEKRLRTYLKRYGVSKLRMWTFYANN